MTLRFSVARALPVLLAPALALAGCTSDLPAPDNYTPTSQGSSDTSGDLMIDCTMLPAAAVGAEYSFVPDVMLDDPTAVWAAATPLPDGLEIDPTTGEIRGVPTTAGPGMFDITVTTVAREQSFTCDIDVAGQLSVDNELAVGTVPFCLRPGEMTLLDLVVEGTGDGSPITCTTPGGSGNGRIPAGISVNPDTCAIEGTNTEERYGTWTFIVRGEQNGAEVFSPYCVSNETNNGYESITVDHSGLAGMGQDATLIPIFRRFNPSAAVRVGATDDPRVEVSDTSICGGNTCSYRFQFSINSSPFDAESLSLDPNDLLRDENNDPIGFFHELRIDSGNGPVPEAFRNRPWTVNIDMDYCLATNSADCAEGAAFDGNSNGALELSILMMPE